MKRSIYIFSSGKLVQKNNTILFDGEDGKKYLPVADIDSIYIFGEVDINKQFLEFACKNQIILHFYNYYEYYVGSFYPREHLNSGYVLLRQCECYNDFDKRLDLAKSFVRGSIKNIVTVLKYYNRRGIDLNSDIEKISALLEKGMQQSSVETLMAFEGNCRQEYYKCFNKILNNDDFTFTQRSKRPPRDRINSLISFGNSIIYTQTLSQIYQTQLDPRIGYLHSTNERRFTLNLDIAEIFKPIITDRAIFSLINKKIITKKDFSKELGGILLNESGRKKFIEAINEKLNMTINYPGLDLRVSYKKLIRMECYKLQKYFTEGIVYEPFEMRW